MSDFVLEYSKARIVASHLVLVLAFLFCASFASHVVAQGNVGEVDSLDAVPSVSLKSLLTKYESRGREKWESDIQRLEQRNLAEKYADDALLFYGSSSFRLWDSLATDMSPHATINRGYGGAKFVDMVLFADRMLTPHRYRCLMLFSANDVKGESDDSRPEEVECALREIIRVSRAHQPDAPVFILEVTPTEKRYEYWAKTRKINAVIREVALSTDNCWCVVTAEHFLTANGQPRTEFFVQDGLHLNQRGYRRWARLIKSTLNLYLKSNVSEAEK